MAELVNVMLDDEVDVELVDRVRDNLDTDLLIEKDSVGGKESDQLIVSVVELDTLTVIDLLSVPVGGGVTEKVLVELGDSVQLIDAEEVGVGGGVNVEVTVKVFETVPVTDIVAVSVGGGVNVTDLEGVSGGVVVRETVDVIVVDMLAERDISSVSVTNSDGNDDDSDRLKLRVLVRGRVIDAVADVVVDGDWPEREKVGEKVPRLRDMVIEPAVIDMVVEIVKVPVGSSDTVQVPEPDRVGYE